LTGSSHISQVTTRSIWQESLHASRLWEGVKKEEVKGRESPKKTKLVKLGICSLCAFPGELWFGTDELLGRSQEGRTKQKGEGAHKGGTYKIRIASVTCLGYKIPQRSLRQLRGCWRINRRAGGGETKEPVGKRRLGKNERGSLSPSASRLSSSYL